MAKLFVVATPIGNLKDMTLRAIEILKSVDFILCEDTRVTAKLLNAYNVKTKMTTYHANNSEDATEKILQLLADGKNLALVSDAGTPTISDPGVLLVQQVRERFNEEEVEILAIPGANALVSALSVSGISSAQFVFLGFLPHKKGRDTLFKEITQEKRTVVFYESPHRILKTLERLAKDIPKRKISVARELTKIHEEVLRGTASELLEIFEKNKEKVRGEFVVILGE